MFWKKKGTEASAPPEEKKGIFKKLAEGLRKSSSKISTGITDIFTKKKLDADTQAQLEELLITSDLGPVTAAKLAAAVAKSRYDKEVTPEEIKEALAAEINAILVPVEKPLDISTAKPFVILMVGVNGAGKTTTIGKWAHQLKDSGKTVMLAAGDTFRAAAVEQLKVWGERANCPVIAKEAGADAAALAFEAVDRAIADNIDVLFIDTAGRLQNRADLMAELEKIVRVIKKKLPDAPHATVLTLDATVGQNAHSQAELFKQIINVTGIVVTKLDGTAKGGVLVSLAERFVLPVYAIGIGEGIEDLRAFRAQDFAKSLVGLQHIEDTSTD